MTNRLTVRYILLVLAFLLAAVLFPSCSRGIPADLNEALSRLRAAGYPNVVVREEYEEPKADGTVAVLLVDDPDSGTFLRESTDGSSYAFVQAILFETEEQAEVADELLQDELSEAGDMTVVRAGRWLLIGPQSAVDAFRGTKSEETP